MTLKDEEHAKILTEKLEHHTMLLEQDRARGLKLEASKWKQAMKEAEKRLTLEVKAGYDRGRDEREAEMIQEASSMEQKHQLALQTAHEEAKEVRRVLEEQHAAHFKALDLAHQGIPGLPSHTPDRKPNSTLYPPPP